jgi:hypothetical protein
LDIRVLFPCTRSAHHLFIGSNRAKLNRKLCIWLDLGRTQRFCEPGGKSPESGDDRSPEPSQG